MEILSFLKRICFPFSLQELRISITYLVKKINCLSHFPHMEHALFTFLGNAEQYANVQNLLRHPVIVIPSRCAPGNYPRRERKGAGDAGIMAPP